MLFAFVDKNSSSDLKQAIFDGVDSYVSSIRKSPVDYDNIVEDLARARDNGVVTTSEYNQCIISVNSVRISM